MNFAYSYRPRGINNQALRFGSRDGRSSQIRQRNALNDKALKEAVQGLGKG